MAEYNYSCNNKDDCVVTTDKSKAEESDAIIFDFVAQCFGNGEPNTVRKSQSLDGETKRNWMFKLHSIFFLEKWLIVYITGLTIE